MSHIVLPGSIKPCIMPPFDSDAFILGVHNHSSCCMDAKVNHFTNLRRSKQKILPEASEMVLSLKPLVQSIGISPTIKVAFIILQSRILHLFQTFLMHCCCHNIGASKQRIISHCLIAPSWNNILMNASSVGSRNICQNNSLDPKICCFFLWHPVLWNFVFSTSHWKKLLIN